MVMNALNVDLMSLIVHINGEVEVQPSMYHRQREPSDEPRGPDAPWVREKEQRLRARIRSTNPLPLVKDFSDLAWMLRERGDFSEALSVVKRGLALPGLTRKERVVLLNIKAFILYDLGRETDAQQVEEEIRQLSGSR